ncbi:MAG: type II toxin-antitoxin system HicA family toxin [Acidobacteriota bacterium]
MPRKVRDLAKDLRAAGFEQMPGGGKGSHRKFTHPGYQGAVTISGSDRDDAKPYQEKQVRLAIKKVSA